METNVAYVYLRVSDRPESKKGDDADDPESIKTQLTACKHMAALKALYIAGEYADEWKSGGSLKGRTELEKCLNVVCAQKATLLVYSLLRLARSTRDAIAIAERLEATGANLISVKEQIDTSTPLGRFAYTLFASLGQLEREQVSERTSEGMRRRQADGQIMSSQLPFGFERDPANPQLMLVSDRESRIAKLILNLRQKNWTHRKIIASLNRRKIVFRNSPWSSYSIARAIEFAEKSLLTNQLA